MPNSPRGHRPRPMGRYGPVVPMLRAALVFAVVALMLTGAVGAFLAANPDAGPYFFTSIRPATNNNRMTETMAGHPAFVRTPNGARFDRSISAQSPPTPTGVALGSMAFELKEVRTGFPEPVRREWSIVTIEQVEPAPGGPPASDRNAWNRILAEALAQSRPVPAGLLAGDSTATSWSARNFVYNAGWRMLHAPTWLAPCLLAALVPALLVFVRADRVRRRRRRGLCPGCGYDLRGLVVRPHADGLPVTCPECGGSVSRELVGGVSDCSPSSGGEGVMSDE